MPDRDGLRLGRQYTSGKECIPMTVTLGNVLQTIGRDVHREEKYGFFMPATCGPCRFGMYHLFDKVVFDSLGLADRVRVVSPSEDDFFGGVSKGCALRLWGRFCDRRPPRGHASRRAACRKVPRGSRKDIRPRLPTSPGPPGGGTGPLPDGGSRRDVPPLFWLCLPAQGDRIRIFRPQGPGPQGALRGRGGRDLCAL